MKYCDLIKSANELIGDEGLWRLPSYVIDEYVLDQSRAEALDDAINTIMSGNDVLITGSPGTGKTAFMLILLKELIGKGYQVGVIRMAFHRLVVNMNMHNVFHHHYY